MANVRVALRVRPLSKRETKDGGRIIMEVDGNLAKIRSLKVDSRPDGFGNSREKVVTFSFDYCYWSVNPEDPQYASQDVVFQDLGTEVLSGASKGYNICLFAYGQTGSGKTYTMLGTPASVGLTPRICENLFIREEDYSSCSLPSSCKIKVSFLEIYNERVRDLLRQSDQKKSYTLRVREHPEMGPYVQGLSQHVVTNYNQVIQLLEEGIANRITAATHVHEASSRSHAIFTIYYTQAILDNNLPSEIASKINLVDLAGSERADPSYCKDRITEGANINKSLVTLGIVISTLAQNSQIFSSCQSLNGAVSDGGDSAIPRSLFRTSSGGGPSRKQSYIPYRDSVLTWLLKDSLGGNSKTIMIATVSPAHTSYSETMSTLRYASNAKNIINKPRVNEDANVRLIRELREEIERLKAMLLSFELRNFSSLKDEKDENMKELVVQNEMKIGQLTKDWMQKWSDWKALMENYSVDINRRKAGLVIDSSLPHLMVLEDDVLSTSVVLYHLKEGTTKIGRIDSDQEQDIVLQGQWIERDHCTITSACGMFILRPTQGARCTVNGREVTDSCRLTQGAIITLGKAQKFRFNYPAEAAVLRRQRQVGEAVGGSGSLEWLDLVGYIAAPLHWKERRQGKEDPSQPEDGETSHRVPIQQEQPHVEELRPQILRGQSSAAEQELEFDQAHIDQQIEDNPETQPSSLVQSQKRVVQLQLLQRHARQRAEWNIHRKRATVQLERIIRKQRLLEAPKNLEDLKVLCWLQDDSTQEPPDQVPSLDAMVPGPRHRSKSTSCSTLSLQGLCSQCLPQPHSVFLHWDPCTTVPPVPDSTYHMSEEILSEEHAASYRSRTRTLNKSGFFSGQGQLCTTRGTLAMKAPARRTCLTVSPTSASIQEMGRLGKQPCWQMSQDTLEDVPGADVSTPLRQPANKLKPRHEPMALTSQNGKAQGFPGSGSVQAGWPQEGNLVVHKAAKGIGCNSSQLREHKQASGCGKAAKTFWTKSKPLFPKRTSNRQQKMLAARVRDTTTMPSPLPRGKPLKRQHSAQDPNTVTPDPDSSPRVCHAGENDSDLSDANSDYSADSLTCACAQAPVELLKPADPQGEKLNLPEPENSESDYSQISQDSLTEREYQTLKDNPKGKHPPSGTGNHRAPMRVCGGGFPKPSDCVLLAQAHKSFSLDSLIDAEEEVGAEQQEKALLGSPEELPTETFWHLQNSAMSLVSQEAASNSFYLDPPFQPYCGQPELAGEAGYSEKLSMPSGLLPSRGSPLISMDSWFSCDSKINPSNPPGTVSSLCPSPDIQEFQPCGWEKPGYWLTKEELKPSSAEANSFKLLQCGAEPPCGEIDGYTIPASNTSKLSLWETQRLTQLGAASTCQRRGVSDTSQQSTSEASGSSSVSNVLAASAASFTHSGSVCEMDWSDLQQKYLRELSHPVLETIVQPTLAFPCLDEDTHSLAQASTQGDLLLPVGPGKSGNVNFNNFSVHLAESSSLRAEKEQDGLSAKLEDRTNFFRANESEISYNEISPTYLESRTSGTTTVHAFAAESKIANSMAETCEVKQNTLEEYCHSSRKPELMTSSDECCFLKNPCHSNGIMATKDDRWPQGWLPLKNIASQSGQRRHNSYHPLRKEKGDCQESFKDTDTSFPFLSDPEFYPLSAPGNPVPISLQPPPLETFYVTKSRDALTETALEIPACRKAGIPFRKDWDPSHDHQVPCNSYMKNNWPVLLQSSTIASSQQTTAGRPVDLNTREVIGEIGKRERSNSVSFSVAPDKHLFSSASTKTYEFENQVKIVNKHRLLALKEKGKATTQSCGNASSNSCVSGKPLLASEPGEVWDRNEVLRQSQAFAMDRQFSSGSRSEIIWKTINLGHEKNILGEMANSLRSRSVDRSTSSPVTVTQGESHTHKWEGKNETELLGKTLYPKDSSKELYLPGADSAYERFHTAPSFQGRHLSDCRQPEESKERTKAEPYEEKQNKIHNDDEMAGLIRSVMQLEHSILEMESTQNKQLLVSPIPAVSKEIVFQDSEKDDHVPRPGSPREHMAFQNQASYAKQQDDIILSDSEVREMKEFSSWMEKDPQMQSPFKTRGWVEEVTFMGEPVYEAELSRSTGDIWDDLGTHTDNRESNNDAFHTRKLTTLASAIPLQCVQERSSKDEGNLRSVEELETAKGFQKKQAGKHISSSKQKELKVQRRIEEMIMQMRGSLQEDTRMISSTQNLPNPSLLCMSRFVNQETICPLLSQTDSSIAASHLDLTNTFPLISPNLSRNYFYVPDSVGIFSVDCMLDPTVFKIHDKPLVARIRQQDQSENSRSHNPQGHVRGITSVSHSAWCESAVSMLIEAHDQSGAPESISLREEDRIAAHTTLQDAGGGFINSLMEFNTKESFAPETEAVLQKKVKRSSPLNWVSSRLEKSVSSPLEESDFQVRETRQKMEKAAKDLGLINDVFSVPTSPTEIPLPEPRMWDPSAQASFCLALLEEVRQAKAQGKQLSNFVAKRTVFPYHKTLVQPECSSGASGRPQYKQMDQSVSGKTSNGDEAQGFHGASLSSEPGRLLTYKQEILQATPFSEETFQLLSNPENHRGTWFPSQTVVPTELALGKSHCTGELRHLLGVGEQFRCRFSSSEVTEKKEEMTSKPPPAPLGTDCFFSSLAVEEDSRVEPEKMVPASSSQASEDDPGVIQHVPCPLTANETIAGSFLDSQGSHPEHRAPSSSGTFSLTALAGKSTSLESQSVLCDVQSSANLSGSKQDYIQCLEACAGSEEGRSSPKQGILRPGALRRVVLEDPLQQCANWKGRGGSEREEVCRLGSKHLKPSSSPAQSSDGAEVVPSRCTEETVDCIVSGSIEGSRTLSTSGKHRENRALSSLELCSSQHTAAHACSTHASTSLLYGGGDPEKGTSQAVLNPNHPPYLVPSGTCSVDERGANQSRGPDVLLAHGLKPRGMSKELGAAGGRTLEHSTTAMVFPLSQACSSAFAPVKETNCLSHSTTSGSSSSAGEPERKFVEKKASTCDETASPVGMCSAPLRKCQDSCASGQNSQAIQMKPKSPVATGRLNAQNSNGEFDEDELVGPKHGCLENTPKCLPEKPQLCTECKDHSGLESQTKFVASLKHIQSTQVDSPWELEEQQRDQASEDGKNPPQGGNSTPSDEDDLDNQIRDSWTEEKTLPMAERWSSDLENLVTGHFGQSGPEHPAQKLDQPSPDRKQSSSHHQDTVPVISVSSDPKHSHRSPHRPQFSVVSSSRSLQELNLSVEPPSPTDNEPKTPNPFWEQPPEQNCCSGELTASGSLKAKGSCSQTALSNLDSRNAAHGPLRPTTLPYPASSALSCMPTPDFMTSCMSGTLEEGRTEKLGSQAGLEGFSGTDKKTLCFDSSDINPFILPWYPERPGCIGWKEYVFGSRVDSSCSEKPQGMKPSNVAQTSSINDGLEDQWCPFHSHLSTHVIAQDLSVTHNSTDSIQASNEALERWDSSFALGRFQPMTSPEGADKGAQVKGLSDEASLKSKPPLPEGSTAGPVDEILLYPSAADQALRQAKTRTLEQGTQTFDCRLPCSCTNVSSAPELSVTAESPLVSWTSMHNLSLHLSQLLHSTSELLGSLSQPNVAEKEQKTKKQDPGEVLRTDSCTQTIVDKGSQTDLCSLPLPPHVLEANAQEVSLILEELDSGTLTMSQEKGFVPVALEKRKARERAKSLDHQEENTHYGSILPPSRLRFQKDPFGQKLPSVSSQFSPNVSLPPSSQQKTTSCLALRSSNFSYSQGLFPKVAESGGEPPVQKKQLGLTSALLVDRASSPILTLSASAQGSCLLPDSPSVSALSGQPLESHQKLISSQDLPPNALMPPVSNCLKSTVESDGTQRLEALCGEGRSPLERHDRKSCLEVTSLDSPPNFPDLQDSVLGQPPQQLHPGSRQAAATCQQRSTLSSPTLRSRSWGLAESLVHELTTSPKCGPLSSKGPSGRQCSAKDGSKSSSLLEPQPSPEVSFPKRDFGQLSPSSVSDLIDSTELQASVLGSTEAHQPRGLLSHTTQMCLTSELPCHSLRELPVQCEVQDDSPVGLGVTQVLGNRCDLSSGEQGEKLPHAHEEHSQTPQWPQREPIPLKIGTQNLSLSIELTEAKLHRGFGETDALLQVLQSGTGEALVADKPALSTKEAMRSTWEDLYARQKKAIQTLWGERTERLKSFHQTRNLSPRKQLCLLPTVDLPLRGLDLPSRRREYLQQLRKDVVHITRNSEDAIKSVHQPSDIELMLKDYQQAREEAKVEIACARSRLRERTEQEKLKIRQQIVSQLLREEKKLHTLANSSSLCTSSNGSLSSGVTSGYSSSPTLSGQLQSPDSLMDTNLSDLRDTWLGDGQGHPAGRHNSVCLPGSSWKSSAYGRASSSSRCCSPSSLSSGGTCLSSYQDLAKHIVNISMANVMAACSDNLQNLFTRQAAAGWNYQGEEQKVQLYYKVFSSTRHGFLGAGVVPQPLPQVWTAVSDPTLWPLYHKTIQTARLHQRVTNSISLVYLVCSTTLCALKQPRDFCCVCVEAKEGHLSIMAAQSVYDTSMPRPSREMVRGEILPSAWILQPLTLEGKEITRVIYLAQVELGAPGFPPQLLGSFIKQQPLVIARLASFLGS